MERAWNSNHKAGPGGVDLSPNCPRCGSCNTKFCYYNNYSLTQPRYFCKGCRRYWTKGGSLRNVPVGGGCRKNRRGSKPGRLSTDATRSSSLPCLGNCPVFLDQYSFMQQQQQQDSSHIDLALVYANFLNQAPDTKPAAPSFGLPELEPSLEFTNSCTMVRPNLECNRRVPLLNKENVDNGLAGSLSFSDLSSAETQIQLRESDEQSFNYSAVSTVFDSIDDKQDGGQVTSSNQVLQLPPPLPTSEAVLWLNPSLQSTAEATQEPILGAALDDDDHHHHHRHQAALPDPNNLFFGNWSPFDFSSDDP